MVGTPYYYLLLLLALVVVLVISMMPLSIYYRYWLQQKDRKILLQVTFGPLPVAATSVRHINFNQRTLGDSADEI